MKKSHGHRRLQARAYPVLAQVISNHAYLYHENWTRRPSHSTCVLTNAQT